jgi:hypothetical protein
MAIGVVQWSPEIRPSCRIELLRPIEVFEGGSVATEPTKYFPATQIADGLLVQRD